MCKCIHIHAYSDIHVHNYVYMYVYIYIYIYSWLVNNASTLMFLPPRPEHCILCGVPLARAEHCILCGVPPWPTRAEHCILCGVPPSPTRAEHCILCGVPLHASPAFCPLPPVPMPFTCCSRAAHTLFTDRVGNTRADKARSSPESGASKLGHRADTLQRVAQDKV